MIHQQNVFRLKEGNGDGHPHQFAALLLVLSVCLLSLHTVVLGYQTAHCCCCLCGVVNEP